MSNHASTSTHMCIYKEIEHGTQAEPIGIREYQ